MSAKRLEPGSKWSHLDKDGDGVVSDDEIAMEERMIELEDMRSDMENEDKKQDAQRNMAWFALFGMLLYPALVVFSIFTGLDKAADVLGDIATTYFVSVAAIVAAFYGKEALAARMANMKRLETSEVTAALITATKHPLINGITIAKTNGNQPKEKNALSFFPLLMPISNRKIARNPLKRSSVKGFIPSACSALAIKPMHKLPSISSTLPLVNACFNTVLFFMASSWLSTSLLKVSNKRPTIMAGDSMSAIMATIWPCNCKCCISKKDTAVTKVTALTEP